MKNPIIENGYDFDLSVRVVCNDDDDWEIPKGVSQIEKDRVLLRREFINEYNKAFRTREPIKTLIIAMLNSKKYETLKNDHLVGIHCWQF